MALALLPERVGRGSAVMLQVGYIGSVPYQHQFLALASQSNVSVYQALLDVNTIPLTGKTTPLQRILQKKKLNSQHY